MFYKHVCLESFGYVLPGEIVSSAEIEARLAPLYERLRLPEGRLELMSGIRERRFWAPGTMPSEKSIVSGEQALDVAGFGRSRVGALIHASVCRDHLEPATASRVHHHLGLPSDCVVYDVSNACLGILNGILQVANMIELGQIEAGLVVGTEGSRQLVETTIDALNRDTTLTRSDIKLAVASLTIGSASCGVLLCHESVSQTGNRLLGAAARSHSEHHELCRSGRDEAAADGMRPLMTTDSERLLAEGVATGAATFERFLDRLGWSRESIHKTFCHQVGVAHRRLLLETLRLDPAIDFGTLEWLGNTGSAALPITMALGAAEGRLAEQDQFAMLGIGSGINCVMIGGRWERSLVAGVDEARPAAVAAV